MFTVHLFSIWKSLGIPQTILIYHKGTSISVTMQNSHILFIFRRFMKPDNFKLEGKFQRKKMFLFFHTTCIE